MNLTKLFELQRKLDEHIIKEKGLDGEDLLPKKILALQVELGELANEWRGFKYWSKNQNPRALIIHKDPHGQCEPIKKNPLLEEYVDCLHFILSIGLELKFSNLDFMPKYKLKNITDQFNEVFEDISGLRMAILGDWDEQDLFSKYRNVFMGFVGLGEMLGFTWKQIEQSYLDKNKVNHERQESGY